jgi:hypothetical protein
MPELLLTSCHLTCCGPSRRSNEATGRPLASHPRACNVGSFVSRSRGRLTLREFTSRFDPLGKVAASPSRAATSSSHSSAVKCSSCKIQPLWGNHDRNRLTARNGREEAWGDKVRRSAYDDRDLKTFAFRIRLGFGRLNGAYWIRRGEGAFEALVQPTVNFVVSFCGRFGSNGVLWPSGPSFGTNTPRPNGPTLEQKQDPVVTRCTFGAASYCERTGS